MAEKKKILYIVEAMGGGVFTYIVDLANELVNKYDMYIAYAVRKQTPKNYKDYFDKRIHLIEVKNFRRAIDPMKDIAAFFEVKKIAAEIKPDIIHLHSSKAGAIGRMAFNGKIPMFYTPHGYSFLMENYKPMKRRMFKLIESVCAKRNCTTISCSVGEHQESLKLTKHATYVNNGINMAELQEIIDKTEKVEHSFTVYTLGRICYQKNPTLFNEIAESLPDVKFVWIGDGELRDQLTSENIEITGWADRSTAIRYAVNLGADTYMVIASGMIGYFKLDKFSSVSLKELLHFSMPIVPSSIALWVVNLSDRLIIIHFMGAAANGIYAVANKIPSLYSTAYGIFNLAWTETASKVSDDGNPAEYYTKLFSGLFKFLIGVMLALIAVTPIIFSVLVKGDYGAAFFQVPILYFGIFFNSLVNFYSGIYIALKRTKQVGYSSVAGAIINAAINVLLIRIIGLYAASISTAVSFFVIAIYRAIDLNKIIEIKYNKKEIEIGMGLFLISTICLNCNQVWTIVLCWGIAGIYNITQNMQIAKRIIGKFLKK